MYPNLKLAIFRQGMHQKHLAKELGIQEAILSKIIRGNRRPSEAEKNLLATYLQSDVNWLFERYELSMAGIVADTVEDSRESKNGKP
jgi:transcriptional regulator with XRE-family HTH domain